MDILGQLHLFVIYAMSFFAFLYSKSDDYKQYKQSHFLQTLFRFIINIVSSYFLLAYFRNTHFKSVSKLRSVEDVDFQRILIEFAVDFGILMNVVIVTQVIKYLYSKNKKSTILWRIAQSLAFFVCVYTLFYANYNREFSNIIYGKIMNVVPQPHNIILYNSFPTDPDSRFRGILIVILNIIF
jgi:uncharacterized membrane protein